MELKETKGLIKRKVLREKYINATKAMKEYFILQEENDRPIYPHGSTASLMLKSIEETKKNIEAIKSYIKEKIQ